eukprot:6027276-Amphidinium_carterae.1
MGLWSCILLEVPHTLHRAMRDQLLLPRTLASHGTTTHAPPTCMVVPQVPASAKALSLCAQGESSAKLLDELSRLLGATLGPWCLRIITLPLP